MEKTGVEPVITDVTFLLTTDFAEYVGFEPLPQSDKLIIQPLYGALHLYIHIIATEHECTI